MTTDIILLDIPTNKGIPTSPSTWRKLNYRTQWVCTTDIENTCKPLGMLPTGFKPDGSPHYTLPAIIDLTDPSRPVYMSDSMPIVEYLERTYPSPPGQELFPPNTFPFQVILTQFVMPKFHAIVPNLLLSGMYAAKSPEEQADLRRRMEARFKMSFENIEKRGAERELAFKGLEQDLKMLSAAFDRNHEGIFLLGRQVSFADFTIAAWLIMLKVASPDDMWARVSRLDGGRWKRYLDNFHDWMTVDNGFTKAKA
ncbi:hypothetical protein CVT26_011542 [Gymnopilus dilepis]|uniref:Glutathione S-transferase UstS-like C-terminal domain-containing protein n=1 Tax=Gymnopilus dilepis TaxID=231916 RepID=A0A409WSG3_9AGAR|nr:hypothetical protein CVT26_011542 [Gymnopilus dilepis]